MKAAEQGYALAQYNLGFLYENGQGVDKNYPEAFKWYMKAAEQGYALAQYNLGKLYQNGYGETQDRAEALNWIKKAANQGVIEAQISLSKFYVYDFNNNYDKVSAFCYILLAKSKIGTPEVIYRDEERINKIYSSLKRILTTEEIEKATEMAKEITEKIKQVK